MLLPELLSGLSVEGRAETCGWGTSPCQTNDPELWFAESPAVIERAKALCAECPLREMCLESALERSEHAGVWGGELLVEGVIVRNKRGRGRPRKVAA